MHRAMYSPRSCLCKKLSNRRRNGALHAPDGFSSFWAEVDFTEAVHSYVEARTAAQTDVHPDRRCLEVSLHMFRAVQLAILKVAR